MGTTYLTEHKIDIGEKEPKSQTNRFTSSEKEDCFKSMQKTRKK